jgi:uracil-DNA glycosylase family 4
MPPYVPGSGPFNSRIMIIGEAPGKTESDYGKPFIGPTGHLLDESLEAAGIKRDECYITNVVKYQPPYNDFTKLHLIGVDLTDSIRRLWSEEIEKVKPNCILAIGDKALAATTGFTGILNYRGSILLANDGVTKVVPTIHFAALFPRSDEDKGALPWVWLKIIKHDIRRFAEECKSRTLELPQRQLDIPNNSLDVYRFFREYASCTKAANDIESVNCIPVCSGFAFNKHHAMAIPLLTHIGKNKITDMSVRELAECWKLVQEALLKYDLIGQNYKYDAYKQNLIGLKIRKVISDTRLKAHLLFPELPDKSLGVLSSIWTREPYYKEEGKEAKIGTNWDVTRFLKYNGKDCCVEFELDEVMEEDLIKMGEALRLPLVDFYYNYVMRLHELFLAIENRGFNTDHNRKKELKEKYTKMHESVHVKLEDLIGHEINTKSYPQMFSLLYREMNFKERKRDPTSEDSIVALLGNHCKGKDGPAKAEILTTILEDRRIRDQISRQINFCPDYDGRCKTSYNIAGTETARRSTNILKKPVRPKKIGLAFHTISKHGRLAKDIRSMFIPDPGTVFIQGDLSQAEARIVAILAEDYTLSKAFDQVDIHRRTAGMFFGFTSFLNLNPEYVAIVDDLEKDGAERFTGKMFRHAGNYDMGKRRAMNEFNVNAQKYEINTSISEWKAGLFIDLFHNASPNIRGVFHRDIRLAIDATRLLVNPYGRPRVFNAKYDDELYKEAYAFIPQSTVADTTAKAALDIEDEFNGDVKLVNLSQYNGINSENHDALVAQVPLNNWEAYARVMRKHMIREIDFEPYCTLKRSVKLTIPVDIEVSIDFKTGNVTDYAQLNKVRGL